MGIKPLRANFRSDPYFMITAAQNQPIKLSVDFFALPTAGSADFTLFGHIKIGLKCLAVWLVLVF
jgi:hypothetical protein